jgi:hypothetical protein
MRPPDADRAHDIAGAVFGIVVHEGHRPADAFEHPFQAFDQRSDIVGFVQGRDDKRKLVSSFRLICRTSQFHLGRHPLR